MQKQISLKQYFTTVVTASKDLIENFPDEFLHDSSKRAYQLINEIEVYLRSWELTKKEYDTITKKTEQLIEEVEKLEIAYEKRNNWSDVEQFSEDFKSEFNDVLTRPTRYESRRTYMYWQEIWTKKVSLFLTHIETPLLLWMILSSWLFRFLWINSNYILVLIGTTIVWITLQYTKLTVRLWWIPFFLIAWVVGITIRSVI